MSSGDAVHRLADPKAAKKVKLVDGYADRLSKIKAVTATTTLATFLGEVIAETDAGVTIVSDGELHYNPVGAATTSNGKLPAGAWTIHGGKAKLDRVQILSAVSQNVSIFVFEVVQ
jgi:hypothetical protein